jgi:hypothetical protein
VVPIKTIVENAENSNVVSKINLPWRLCGHPEKTAVIMREIMWYLLSIRRKRSNKITEAKAKTAANRTA